MDKSTNNLKEAAMDFLLLAASGKSREAFGLYVGSSFKHHNPFFPGDANSLMTSMEESAKKNPNKILEIQRALQDGDLVAVHSHVRQNPNDLGGAVMHIFRFQDNKVVELWDFGQEVPENSVNENGMF